MHQPSSNQEAARSLQKWINRTLMISGLLSLVLSFIIPGISVLLLLLVIIVCLMVCGILNWRDKLHLGPYISGILLGLLVIWCVALVGFYGPHTKSVGEFGAGMGTRVVNKDLGTALGDSLLEPQVYAAALFGYDCNGLWGSNCSNAPFYAAVVMDYVILMAGAVGGNLLVRSIQEERSN
ncbi:MAG TPA: hypothetical protein VFT53_04755 [Candidatus Saccharimonadales bacterium]|nr:hypothetical protein [Candidatus Saccharimonadales bacterium]